MWQMHLAFLLQAHDDLAHAQAACFCSPAPLMKIARIFDEDGGTFGLEYDNTLGKKHTMRLDAVTYEHALREAKSFLDINADDHDGDGNHWHIE